MTDPNTAMLDLSVELAKKEAAGRELSAAERTISDVLWLDAMVSPNGFDGWLYETPSERMKSTLAALIEVGCPGVLDIVRRALELAGIDPESMSDEEREGVSESLTEKDRERLFELDEEFYEAVDACMEACSAFVQARETEFPGSNL